MGYQRRVHGAVQKVVVRCEDAEENGGKLDLSGCKLIQVPDALYFMIEERNIEVTACNLSSNVIKKIPSKLPSKFSLITDLNLSLTNYRPCLRKYPNGANWRQRTFQTTYLIRCRLVFCACRRSFKSMQQITPSQMLRLN